MIDAVSKFIDASSLRITDNFTPKNALQSQDLLANPKTDDESDLELYLRLTEALTSAPTDSKLYHETLAKRACLAFATADFQRCARDCELYLNCRDQVNFSVEDNKTKVDVLLMLADCCKNEGKEEKGRFYMNEAMRGISELALAHCQGDEDDEFKSQKCRLLKNFLDKRQSLVDAARSRLIFDDVRVHQVMT